MIKMSIKPKSPIFIVGCPRSGTTLLGLMLDSHPRISIAHEAGIFHFLYHHPGKQRWCFSSTTNRKQFFERMKKNSNLIDSFGQNVVMIASEYLEQEERLSAKLVIDKLFAAYLQETGKAVWGEKTPTYYYLISDIVSLYPEAAIIYLMRDPRAIFASMKRYAQKEKGTSNYFWWMVEKPEKGAMLWLDAYESALKWKDRVFLVKYEELTQSPESVLKELTEQYIHIPYDPAMLKYYEKAEDKLGNIPDWHGFITHNLNPANTDRWQSELTADEITTLESMLYGQMKQFGYEPLIENNKPGRLGVATKRKAYTAKRKINQTLRFSAWQILRSVKDIF